MTVLTTVLSMSEIAFTLAKIFFQLFRVQFRWRMVAWACFAIESILGLSLGGLLLATVLNEIWFADHTTPWLFMVPLFGSLCIVTEILTIVAEMNLIRMKHSLHNNQEYDRTECGKRRQGLLRIATTCLGSGQIIISLALHPVSGLIWPREPTQQAIVFVVFGLALVVYVFIWVLYFFKNSSRHLRSTFAVTALFLSMTMVIVSLGSLKFCCIKCLGGEYLMDTESAIAVCTLSLSCPCVAIAAWGVPGIDDEGILPVHLDILEIAAFAVIGPSLQLGFARTGFGISRELLLSLIPQITVFLLPLLLSYGEAVLRKSYATSGSLPLYSQQSIS